MTFCTAILRRRMTRALATRAVALMLGVLLVMALSPAVDACPTCKDSLAHGSNNANMVRGYGWSIMFMMSAPFLILGGISAYFYFEVRKARAVASRNGVGWNAVAR